MSVSHAQPTAEPILGVFHLETRKRRAAYESAPPHVKVQDSPILRQNAIWFCRLRWVVVVVLTAAGIAALAPEKLAWFGLVIHPLWLWVPAAILVGLNLLFTGLANRTAKNLQDDLFVRRELWAQIVCDLLVLTVVVLALGRDLPAGPFMYLFHIILGCIVFSRGASLAIVGLAAALYLVVVGLGLLGRQLPTPIFEVPMGIAITDLIYLPLAQR